MLAGTVVQFLLPLPWLFRAGVPFAIKFDWRNEQVWRVLKLMFPVTIALGMINFDALINSFFGTLVNNQVPAAIDKAFRIYQLPQGLFSVAIATVVFPTLARLAARGDIDGLRRTMASGTRQILLTLIPSAVILMVLAEPITRLVYQRGDFGPHATHLVAQGMFFWALSLPAQGASLIFSRTFFSLQRPWITTALAFANMAVNALISLLLYKPLGLGGGGARIGGGHARDGDLAGDPAARAAGRHRGLADADDHLPDRGGVDPARRRELRGVATCSTCCWVARCPPRSSAWAGRIGAGIYVYGRAVLRMRVTEAHQIRNLLLGRRATPGLRLASKA